jgi:hypothetical protein
MKMTKTDSDLYDAAFKSIEGLAGVVRRLAQEVEVLKSMQTDRGIWDEQNYRKALVKRFIDDHNSAGRLPMTTYSYYPYVLDEASFLKHCFHASDEEIAAFNREVNYVSSLT